MKVGPLETAAAELRAGRHGSAERKLKKHLKLRPRDPIARHLLGLAHLARGEPGPAVRQFRRTEAVTFNSSVLPLADDEVYAYILFMVFPVYNTIETLDPNQIEAAKDLGASTLGTHLRVVLPHAKPGIAVGSIMTFMLAAGSIAVPGLVGCPSYKFRPAQKSGPFRVVPDSVCDPHTILLHGVLSIFRNRAMRQLEIIAPRHQLDVLRRSSEACGRDTQNTRVSAPDGVYRRDTNPAGGSSNIVPFPRR